MRAPRAAAELVLATWTFPPAFGGSAFILQDILSEFPEGSLVAVCGESYSRETSGQSLPFPRRPVHVGGRWGTPRFAQRFPDAYIAAIRRRIVASAREFGARRILAHYPDARFAIAAYEAAVRLRLPLAIYFDILWEERGDCVRAQQGAEATVVRYADRRFAITEYAAEFLARKHGVPFEVIPHTGRPRAGEGTTSVAERKSPRPVSVHFAGGVYPDMNLDAVRRLATVIDSLDREVVLDLFSPMTAADLRALDLPTRRIRLGYVPRDRLPAVLGTSDVLFLPQAFGSPYPEMIRCNFPTKALEYMQTGRPILVHSPKGSYLSDLARREGFAVVVDTEDLEELRRALLELLDNAELRGQVTAAASRFLVRRDRALWSKLFYDKLLAV